MPYATPFEEDGFLILPRFIPKETCEGLKQRAKVLINDFNTPTQTIFSTLNQSHAKSKYFLDSGYAIHFFFEEKAFNSQGQLKYPKEHCINKIGHALHDLDLEFKYFSRQKIIRQICHELGLVSPLLIQSMYICKQPYIGGEVTCHQDGTYLQTKRESVLGLWFALEDATINNGCLWVMPGGHHSHIKAFAHREGDIIKHHVIDESAWDLSKLVPLEVPQGTLIVLHSRLPHMSKENISSKSRHAYTLHVMDGTDEFLPTNWLKRPEPFVGFVEDCF